MFFARSKGTIRTYKKMNRNAQDKNKNRDLVKLWTKYESIADCSNTISFTSGRPGPEVYSFSFKRLRKILISLALQKARINKMADYAPSAGIDQLREVIAEKFRDEEAKRVRAKNIIITCGAQQAISLATRTLIKPGETVLLENQNYVGFQKPISNQKAKIKVLSRSIREITTEVLEQEIETSQPKIFYLSSDFANPTGYTLPRTTRKTIVNLARKYKFLILEDQTYRDLVYRPEDQLPSFKGLVDKTISVGTISKTIIPGLRIGWLAVNDKYSSELLEQKRADDLFTSPLSQMIAAEFIKNKQKYKQHLKKIRRYYQEKMSILLQSLEKYFPPKFSWNRPKGGVFVWIEGPKTFNSQKLFSKAVKNGVSFMPGLVFYYQKPKFNTFRLSISTTPKEKIEEGIMKLAKTL